MAAGLRYHLIRLGRRRCLRCTDSAPFNNLRKWMCGCSAGLSGTEPGATRKWCPYVADVANIAAIERRTHPEVTTCCSTIARAFASMTQLAKSVRPKCWSVASPRALLFPNSTVPPLVTKPGFQLSDVTTPSTVKPTVLPFRQQAAVCQAPLSTTTSEVIILAPDVPSTRQLTVPWPAGTS